MQNFQALLEKAVKGTHKPRSALRSWQWADDNIDYSLVPNYDTPFLSRYDSSRMPFWRDILDDIQDPSVREIAIRKCSRAGYSESVILTDLRFTICEDPALSFYISAKEDLTKGFLEKRVARGMALNKELAKKFKRAKFKGVDIHFAEMDFRATWVANKTATKQDGYQKIYVDEIDLFPEGAIDAIRRRCSAYAMHTIVWGGSIDFERRGDPNKSPILELYAESDKRVHTMTDGNGKDFVYNFSGLKWDQSCRRGDEWDIEAAAASAYYETPSGCIITESERIDYMKAGRWVPTSEKSIRRGYLITAPMIPFFDSSFHELTKRFLSAKARTGEYQNGKVVNPLRVYFAELWAEPHTAKTEYTTEEALIDRVGEYNFGQRFTDAPALAGEYKDKPAAVFVTVDVQKEHFWVEARLWTSHNGGDSGLIWFGQVQSWEELFRLANEHQAERIYIDNGYSLRKREVYETCARVSGVVPVVGNDKLKAIYRRQMIDPYEGTPKQGQGSVMEITINPDFYRTELMRQLKGESRQKWMIPHGTPLEYIKQVTSTRKVMGEWKAMQRDDHAFDTAALQIFAATRHRILSAFEREMDEHAQAGQDDEPET